MTTTEHSDQIEKAAITLGVSSKARAKWRERGRVAGQWVVPIMDELERCRLPVDRAAFRNYSPSSRRRAA